MNIALSLTPRKLERNSFLWSEVRLVVAAVALFLGGRPPVLFILRIPALYGLISSLLTLSWIISGVASVYLVWRWYGGDQKLFGARHRLDTLAFFVSVVSGINLGFAGLFSSNIGMSIASGSLVFLVTGIVYLLSALHLYRRWKASEEHMLS